MAESVSNVIAVLGLLTISVIAVILAYGIVSSYLSRSISPSYQITITYGKLVYITDYDVVNGTVYVSYKGEIGVNNPGKDTLITVCILSSNVTDGSVRAVVIPNRQLCPKIRIHSGYDSYSFIIRIPEDTVRSLGCSASSCPDARNWYLVVYDESGEQLDAKKPAFIVPS